MTRARSLSKLSNPATFTVDAANNIGVNSTSPKEKLNIVGVVSATSFFGDGSSLTGVSASELSGTPDLSIRNLTGVAATFTGVVTYEDVTNVDSVGFATFRKGINVQGAGSTTTTLNVTGVATVGNNISIGDSIFHIGDGGGTTFGFPAADTFNVYTDGSERLRVTSDGDVGIGENSPDVRLHVKETIDVAYSPDNATNGVNNILKLENPSTTANAFAGIAFRTGNGADMYFGSIQQTTNAGDFYFANQNSSNVELMRIKSTGDVGIGTTNPARSPLHIHKSGSDVYLHLTNSTTGSGSGDGFTIHQSGVETLLNNRETGNMRLYTSGTERLRITSTGGVHFNNAELIERVNIVANKLSAATSVNLDNGMVHYYTTNETATANPNIITTAGINTNMATGDTMSVTIMSKPNSAGYFPRISIDGLLTGITTYWSGGSAPSSAESSGVDVNVYQIIKTADATYDVIANTSNFA